MELTQLSKCDLINIISYYSGTSGIGEPWNARKQFFHTNEPLESGNSDNRGIGVYPSCFPHAPIPEILHTTLPSSEIIT